MRKKSLLLFGNYGGQNWGDEAILQGMLALLGKKKKWEVMVVARNPPNPLSKRGEGERQIPLTPFDKGGTSRVAPPPFGLRSFFSFRWLRFFSALWRADLVVFGGGGLLQQHESKAIWLWSWYVLWCKLFRKKILFLGNSFGPITTSWGRRLFRFCLRGARYISVRDSASKKLVEKEVSELTAYETTDLALLTRKLPRVARRKGILFITRTGGRLLDLKPALEKKYGKQCSFVLSDRSDISSSLPQNPSNPPSSFATATADTYQGGTLKASHVLFPESLEDFRKQIASAAVVVSERLHGGVFALQEQVPFLLLSQTPKMKAFFMDRDLGETVLSPKISAKKLSTEIDTLRKRSATMQKKLKVLYEAERKKQETMLPLFLS